MLYRILNCSPWMLLVSVLIASFAAYVADAALLVLTLFVFILAIRMQLSKSLKAANAQLDSAKEELQKRALLDPLTGLPNRVLFEDQLTQAASLCDRVDESIAEHTPKKLAVLFVNLDGFKPVNDSFGHAAGDLVLKEAASRLRGVARNSDTVARLGGDEFVLLMEDVRNVADCTQFANRVVKALAQPFDIIDQQVEISGSVGVVVYPDQGRQDNLVAYADAAMYAVKRSGGAGYALFEPQMEDSALDQLNLQKDLRHAVELEQLELYYQPKVDGRNGEIKGMEALLRWNHPQRGIISPEVFIPIAERFGLINGLGNWVINEVCRQMQAWADEGVRMSVAINLSVHQLHQDDLISRISQTLKRHQVEASQLICELTESVAMKNNEATQRFFKGLTGIGVCLSIDDFGTGYSSLSYLRQLTAKQLKIDRSFINDIESSSDARAIVNAVINLAHVLDLSVVAEGVETEGQRKILQDFGCDELQGFLFSKPMREGEMIAWIGRKKPIGTTDLSPTVMPWRVLSQS
ncbi:MAG: bifunctional diguanylate cyclase/phosphodiesterase [Nitrosospira sp.]|nr:bifunctional diguanylate cyclase/phosphodiesterase [Nitrosospira sp.]